jgi:alpha-N-arabinofuranosidase
MTDAATAIERSTLTIDPDRVGHPVSPRLFGLFFEDINFGLDGGLNANLVVNHSFEGVSLNRKGHDFLVGAVLLHKEPRRLIEPALHWGIVGGGLEVRSGDALSAHGHYARVSTSDRAVLTNHGYPGEHPGMGARAGVGLRFSARVRTDDFEGALSVRLVAADGGELASAAVHVSGVAPWRTAVATLRPSTTALASLEIVASGRGALDLDEVVLVPDDHWGAGDPRWSQGLLRRDLVEAIAAVHPTFLRFPGGCIVEGLSADNAYDWKKTVGPVEQRTGDFSLWALHRPRGDYFQSQQIGFYEFFLLCEDLGIAAIPVVNGGLCCQNMAKGALDIDGTEFAQLAQDILDLIDWATGDPATSEWAALRAAAGHPEPFALDTIGIGNENHGAIYHQRFDLLRAAVRERHPAMEFILSGSPGHSGRKYEKTWEFARASGPELIVDEHFYASPKWFTKSSDRYDSYDRSGPRVFAGEYAAQFPNITTPQHRRTPANTYGSALAEAVFYTGIVRNSDIVVMSSYAPMLNLVGKGQWSQNFIDFNPFTVQPTVNYEMQKLFTAALGDRTVDLPALPAGVFGSATRTDDTLFVHLVNTTDRAIAMPIEVVGSRGAVIARFVAEDRDYRHALRFTDTAAAGELGERPVPAGSDIVLAARAVVVLTARLEG